MPDQTATFPSGKTMQSSHLQHLRYNGETGKMQIEFVNGAVGNYSGVPFGVWHELYNATQPGRVFHQRVKGRYGESVTKKIEGVQ